jgi:hypothetical protein
LEKKVPGYFFLFPGYFFKFQGWKERKWKKGNKKGIKKVPGYFFNQVTFSSLEKKVPGYFFLSEGGIKKLKKGKN